MSTNRIRHLITDSPMGMGRPRKYEVPRSQLSCMIDPDLHEELRELSDETGVPLTRLVEDALRAFLTSRYRMGMRGDDVVPGGES